MALPLSKKKKKKNGSEGSWFLRSLPRHLLTFASSCMNFLLLSLSSSFSFFLFHKNSLIHILIHNKI